MSAKIYDAEMQYLLIEETNSLGLDAQGRVAWTVGDGMGPSGERLTPLLVYGLVVPAYRYITRLLVDPRSPMAIGEYLSRAWSKTQKLGMPLRLEVRPGLLGADKGFSRWTKSLGVECSTAQNLKSIAAFATSVKDVGFAAMDWKRPVDDCENPLPLVEANAALQDYDTTVLRWMIDGHGVSMRDIELDHFRAWLNRGQKFFDRPVAPAMDWDVDALPRSPLPKIRQRQEELDNPMWLEEPIEALKELLGMWPTGKKQFCKEMGLSVSALNSWMSCNEPIEQSQFENLRTTIHLEEDEDFDDSFYLTGGCLLIADTPKNAITVYDELSDGGDLMYSFEALSTSADFNGFRVLVFESYSKSPTIILFKRGGKAEAVLNRNDLINFQGPVHVPPEIAAYLEMMVIHADHAKFGHVGCGLRALFGEWLDDQEDSQNGISNFTQEDEDFEDETALLVLSLMVSRDWAQERNILAQVKDALKSRLPAQAIASMIENAFAEGFRIGGSRQ